MLGNFTYSEKKKKKLHWNKSHLLRNFRKQAATYLFWLMHKETQCKKQTETSLTMLLENVLMTENCIGHHCCRHYHHHYM